MSDEPKDQLDEARKIVEEMNVNLKAYFGRELYGQPLSSGDAFGRWALYSAILMNHFGFTPEMFARGLVFAQQLQLEGYTVPSTPGSHMMH